MSLLISGNQGLANTTSGSINFGLSLDQSGYTQMPFKPCVFAWRAAGTNAWEIFSTTTTYIFNYVYTNRGGYYNSSTGIFTCPLAGTYKVTTSHLTGGNGGYAWLRTLKNGTIVDANGNHTSMGGVSMWTTSHTTNLISCAASDTLNIAVITGASATIYSEYSLLTIEFLG